MTGLLCLCNTMVNIEYEKLQNGHNCRIIVITDPSPVKTICDIITFQCRMRPKGSD